MKMFRLGFVAPVAAMLGLALNAACENLVQNPGFEDGMTGWECFGRGWRASNWRNVEASDAYSGAMGMVDDISPGDTEDEWRAVSQAVPVRGALSYTARVRIRTFNMGQSASYLEIQFLDARTNLLKQFQSEPVTNDQPFRVVAIEGVGSPRDAVSAVVRGVVHVMPGARDGVGFHVFDDFELDAVQRSGRSERTGP